MRTGLLPGLLSGLVCAGANHPRDGRGEDGLLTAEEVSWLDLAARDLMVSFYSHLWSEGLTPAAALLAAQLEALARQVADGSVDPFSWGAFVLSAAAASEP